MSLTIDIHIYMRILYLFLTSLRIINVTHPHLPLKFPIPIFCTFFCFLYCLLTIINDFDLCDVRSYQCDILCIYFYLTQYVST